MKKGEILYARKFPEVRLRRLRRTSSIRKLVQETRLSVNDLVCPLFIQEGLKEPHEVESMPGIFRLPPGHVLKNIESLYELGIRAFLLFGLPKGKDSNGSSAFHSDGVVQRSVELLRKNFSDRIVLISDVCLCQYTTSGQCGIMHNGLVDNDRSLKILGKIAVSHANSGVDFVAPSAMMDGQVRAIRQSLDAANLMDVGIMGYSAKLSSNLYAPFRDAAHSLPFQGDRKSYQMAYTNSKEAMQEISLDSQEGADIIMVKPALPYLDLIYRAKMSTLLPICAYSVSGEYAMVKAAASEGFINEDEVVSEFTTCIKRAGADIIITYHAKKLAELLLE
jgi:porphobilinogen synthase